MSRRYFAWVAFCFGLLLFGVKEVQGAPQEPKPELPRLESKPQQSSGGLFSSLFESKLERALKRGLKPEGSIAKELDKLPDFELSSQADARAVCETLATLLQREVENVPVPAEDFLELALLFQLVTEGDTPAFETLERRGIPLLAKLYDRQLERLDPANVEHLLTGLHTLAMYGAIGSERRILTALRRQLGVEDAQWEEIFLTLFTPPIASDEFFSQIKLNLPAGKTGLALLQAANEASLEGDLPTHPFDSAAGRDRLRVWLSNQDDGDSAYRATVALAFVSEEVRKPLLPLALEYPDPSVQLEAAWAAGRNGDEQGLRLLARATLSLDLSVRAKQYLEELEREDLIPEEAKAPDFSAKAEFSDWLQHPNELGVAPDEVEIIDRRELKWPPEMQPRTVWLVRYFLRDSLGLDPDDVGCGLVGSGTWCFFDPEMLRRPPEDIYAIHCGWEMEQADLIEVQEADSPELSAELLKLLKSPIENPSLLASARVASKLKLPSRKVYIAKGKVDGVEGWMLFSDLETVWYPKTEHPESTSAETILRLHLGGQILGFKEKPNRKEFLSRELPQRTPEEFSSAYEKLMDEFWGASPADQAILFVETPLSSRFEEYLEALVKTKGGDKEQYLLEKFSEILDWAEEVDEPAREVAFGANGLLSKHFEEYVSALVSSGNAESVPVVCERFAPHWDNFRGYSLLGNALYEAGRADLAERWFGKIAEIVEYRHLVLDMGLLAEILHRRGETQQAKELLLDCLSKQSSEARQSPHVRKLYGVYRGTYLKLFPNGGAELEAKGLPENPF
ncbi:MAG: hypothetical protein ACKO81_03700 [Planctomycetota bacterium]